MPGDGKGQRDGRVHVSAGDVANGVDHDGDDQSAGDRGSELGNQAWVAAAEGSSATGDKHQ